MYQQIAEAYALDPATVEFLERSNPWALGQIAERLLEAHERGMWAAADPRTIDGLRQALGRNEAALELRSESLTPLLQVRS